MFDSNKDDVFVELAKVKSQPTPITTGQEIESETDDVEGQLTVDVYQNGDMIVVQSAVAGVDEDNLEINLTPESVTIRGKREKSQKVSDTDYFYQECFWGSFSRTVILPTEIDTEKSTAALKNGVLTIKMPKLDRKKGKKLKVSLNS